jgi:hypothetical protein
MRKALIGAKRNQNNTKYLMCDSAQERKVPGV